MMICATGIYRPVNLNGKKTVRFTKIAAVNVRKTMNLYGCILAKVKVKNCETHSKTVRVDRPGLTCIPSLKLQIL